jgi:hypothetical protein
MRVQNGRAGAGAALRVSALRCVVQWRIPLTMRVPRPGTARDNKSQAGR